MFPIRPLADGLQHAFNPHTTGPGINATDIRSLAIWTAVGVFLMVRFLRRPQGEVAGRGSDDGARAHPRGPRRGVVVRWRRPRGGRPTDAARSSGLRSSCSRRSTRSRSRGTALHHTLAVVGAVAFVAIYIALVLCWRHRRAERLLPALFVALLAIAAR